MFWKFLWKSFWNINLRLIRNKKSTFFKNTSRKCYYSYQKNFKIPFLRIMLETMQARFMIVWAICFLLQRSLNPNHPRGFSETAFSRENVKPCFFVTFDIIIKLIFPENFIKILQVIRKIWIFFPSIVTIFFNILDF